MFSSNSYQLMCSTNAALKLLLAKIHRAMLAKKSAAKTRLLPKGTTPLLLPPQQRLLLLLLLLARAMTDEVMEYLWLG
jgi:hypothetical protein